MSLCGLPVGTHVSRAHPVSAAFMHSQYALLTDYPAHKAYCFTFYIILWFSLLPNRKNFTSDIVFCQWATHSQEGQCHARYLNFMSMFFCLSFMCLVVCVLQSVWHCENFPYILLCDLWSHQQTENEINRSLKALIPIIIHHHISPLNV